MLKRRPRKKKRIKLISMFKFTSFKRVLVPDVKRFAVACFDLDSDPAVKKLPQLGMIDVCVPDISEVIDGCVVGRAGHRSCYCVSEKTSGGGRRVGEDDGGTEVDGFIEKGDVVHRPGTLRCS